MKQALGAALLLTTLVSCSPAPAAEHKTVVVTYAILGSLVSDLVGDAFEVKVVLPNGADVHEWAPSPRDIETLQHASLIVRNGLNLEEGLAKALDQARTAGVQEFVASDHIAVRTVKPGQVSPQSPQAARRKARSNGALCATRTQPCAKLSSPGSTEATRGAAASIQSVIPVSC